MKSLCTMLAVSLDGFICGKDSDISGFVNEGSGVQKYLADLKQYETTIMGKNTYEFGYAYGLQPGQPAYAHMDHYIFSKSLKLENPHEKVHVVSNYDVDTIHGLKKSSKTDIYVCGGGIFAGWLLEHQLIDVVKVKINPLLLGKGIRLFGSSEQGYQLKLIVTEAHDGGLQFHTYTIKYS